MAGRHRSVVSGVHRLDQRQHLVAAHFADDDPVGAQAEGGPNEIGERHRWRAVGERGPRLEPDRAAARPMANSQVSSITRTRSPAAVADNNADSSDVLPDEVAPETNTLQRAARISWSSAWPSGPGEFGRSLACRSGSGGSTGRHRRPRPAGGPRRPATRRRGERRRSVRCGRCAGRSARVSVRGDARPAGRGGDRPSDRAATVDPDLTAGVDEHLVDRRVAEQHVEVAEPHEPGDGVLRESLLIVA